MCLLCSFLNLLGIIVCNRAAGTRLSTMILSSPTLCLYRFRNEAKHPRFSFHQILILIAHTAVLNVLQSGKGRMRQKKFQLFEWHKK